MTDMFNLSKIKSRSLFFGGGVGFPLVASHPNKEDAATGQNQHIEISGKGMLKVVGLCGTKTITALKP